MNEQYYYSRFSQEKNVPMGTHLSSFLQIALAFLLSVLMRKPIPAGLVGFLFTVFWGCLGFTALYTQLPSPLKWAFGPFSPFAFTAGMAQVRAKPFHDFTY